MRVVRGVGIESEAELPFGALHLLLYPFLDRLDRLAGPQAAAMRIAFGLADGPAPSRFLVGAGTLGLPGSRNRVGAQRRLGPANV